jgi:hypothetical protein
MKCLKLVALDIDGVALNDTFSPVIYNLVKKWGGEYSPEVERNVFSQKRTNAAAYLKKKFNLPLEIDEIISRYFHERELYLKNNPIKVSAFLKDFLDLCGNLNLKIISYGGLDKSHFYQFLKDYANYFDGEKYICTNDFRPGITEIVKTFYQLEFKNVLFIDDVNKVAEEARRLNVPFIGVPSDFAYGFQKQEMIRSGVRHIVSGLEHIDMNSIKLIDNEANEGKLW